MDYDSEIERMKETLVSCLRSEQRLAEVQQSHSESIATLARIDVALGRTMERLESVAASSAVRIAEHEAWIKQADARWEHIDMTLAEIGDKLNGLIGYMDGQNRKQ